MIQKPPFADLIKERHPFFGLTLKQVTIGVICLAVFGAGAAFVKNVVFKPANYDPLQQMVAKIQNLEHEIKYFLIYLKKNMSRS